jgi:hypothetical protein
MLEVKAMQESFENFNDRDETWLSELEIRTMDLENELFELRESYARQQAETSDEPDEEPCPAETDTPLGPVRPMLRAARARPGEAPHAGAPRAGVPEAGVPGVRVPRARAQQTRPLAALHHLVDEAGPDEDDDLASVVHTGPRPVRSTTRRTAPAADRTQALIDQGRRSAARRPMAASRKLIISGAAAAVVIILLAVFAFRSSPSWPPSVATVKTEITQACQNPNVASEPGQVNFACGKDTSQILWVFALMTSNDNPSFSDAKTGRLGLEPIAPNQGGEVAWSLDLHHPYNPDDPVDSLEVAARAINNIIGGATLTSASGKPAVQAGLESSPANCARYTGSAELVSHEGFPNVCAQPVTSAAGQAALVSDTYKQWVVGATAANAYDVSVLFENADNPGNAQVQVILKSLPGAS